MPSASVDGPPRGQRTLGAHAQPRATSADTKLFEGARQRWQTHGPRVNNVAQWGSFLAGTSPAGDRQQQQQQRQQQQREEGQQQQ
eukprot:14193502-Alexandrium_andersonii.AAC.1